MLASMWESGKVFVCLDVGLDVYLSEYPATYVRTVQCIQASFSMCRIGRIVETAMNRWVGIKEVREEVDHLRCLNQRRR